MKIKNEYVKIKIGKKEYTFNNLILNKYLEKIVNSQKSDGSWLTPKIKYCGVSYYRNFDFDETSNINENQFDLLVLGETEDINMEKNKVELNYFFGVPNMEIGETIKKIGFFDEDDDCLACVDVSEYNLPMDNDIAIHRKDTLQTEALFQSDLNIPCPLHYLPEAYNGYKGHLEKVGIGDKVSPRVETTLTNSNTTYEDNKIIFNGIFENGHVLNILEPNYMVPSSNTYPVSIGNAYNYVYLIYNIYYNGSSTGNRYYLKIPVELLGEFDYAIKYERSDD